MRRAVLAIVALGATLVACTESRTPVGPLPVDCPTSTADIQRIILAPTCGASGCHSGTTPAADLDLVSPDLEARIVGGAAVMCYGEVIVRAGDPDGSYLIHKLTDSAPTCGDPMPARAPQLAESKIACLRQWIASLGPGPGFDGGVPDGGEALDAGTDAGGDAGPCAPLADCGGTCTDTMNDSTNCGGCGMTCAAGQSCAMGMCRCPGGLPACGTSCVDTVTDPANCGMCGMACSTGQTCSGGMCTCTGTLVSCGGACVDTTSDAMNCGMCGNVCGAGTVCTGSACVAGSCPGGTMNCGGSCVDTSTSSTNCGSCGTACTVAGEVCSAGTCTCSGGLMLCSSACVDTATSATNCGTCMNACSGGKVCSASACVCPAPTTDCSGTCVDTSSSGTNCGMCGRVCPSGTTCSSSTCTCSGGRTLCGSACVDTTTDPSNCGSCGMTCAAGSSCAGGVCTTCGPSSTLSGQVQPLFTARCTGSTCHSGARPAGGMRLEAGSSYSNLVNVVASGCMDGRVRVVPGSASTSYLVQKLTAVDICSGRQMPLMGTPLPTTQIDLIRSWICRGAMND